MSIAEREPGLVGSSGGAASIERIGALRSVETSGVGAGFRLDFASASSASESSSGSFGA